MQPRRQDRSTAQELKRGPRAAVVLAILALLGAPGCKSKSDDKGHDSHGKSEAKAELCEHGVEKPICTKCNPKLIPVFQAKGDFCKEHGLPESVCPICHPERKGRPAAKGEHKDEPEHAELPRKVRLDPDVVRTSGIKLARVSREALVVTVQLPGELAADPDKSARVSSPVAGRLEQVAFKEGSLVRKGDVLAVLRVPDLGKLQGAFAATTAKARAARSNAERLRGLLDSKLTSEQAYLDARAEADALDAEAKAHGAQLAALGIGSSGPGSMLTLRAPKAGVVIARDAIVGQPVSAEQILASIADLSEVWFLGRVFEKDLGRLELGAKVEIELNAFPRRQFPGTLEYIGQQIDPVARTVTARVRVANPEGVLRLGLFGTARVAQERESRKAAVLVVARTAIVEIAGKQVVFVHQADGDYEMHDVVLGESAVGKVEIVSGLREAEEVVVEGVFTLKSIVLKATLEDGDEH